MILKTHRRAQRAFTSAALVSTPGTGLCRNVKVKCGARCRANTDVEMDTVIDLYIDANLDMIDANNLY